jgi:hypothetical protein
MNQPESDDEGSAADAAAPSATFDEIVSSWLADGSVPAWPDEPATSAPETEVAGVSEVAVPTPTPTPAPARRPEEEHFIPPDPPPLPRLGPPAIVGLTLLVFGIIMAVTPQMIGLNESAGLPLGLVTLALGLGWLVLRAWPSERDQDEDGDGAVL